MNNICKILAVSSVAVIVTFPVSAQDEEGAIPRIWEKLTIKNNSAQTSSVTPAVSEQKKAQEPFNKSMHLMTKEEMIQQIKDEVRANEGILNYIKELKRGKDKNGKEVYTYLADKEAVNIEDLDINRLEKLLNEVNIQASAYQSNVTAQQMQVAAEAQKVAAIQQQMPRTPPTQPPRPPATPPQQPKR